MIDYIVLIYTAQINAYNETAATKW